MTRSVGPEAPSFDALEQPSLCVGFVASLPLFALYEIGLLAGGQHAERASSELMLDLLLAPLGDLARWVRWIVILLLALVALTVLRRRQVDVARAFARTLGEGALGAIALGPVLILLSLGFDASLAWDLPAGPTGHAPGLDRACRLVGASVWEELLFRVGCYGVLFLLAARVTGFLGLARRLALVIGDLVALLGSSILFAAFHLVLFQRWLGRGGEAFDSAVFLWRLLAGLLLAALFRWRGLGVSAWTHGIFNLALALGAGPGVFQSR